MNFRANNTFVHRSSFIVLMVVALSSCVPESKFTEEQNKRKDAEARLEASKAADQDCEAKKTELTAKVDMMQKEITGLQQDTTSSGSAYRDLSDKYNKQSVIYKEILDKYDELSNGSASSNSKVTKALQGTQSQLLEKEDELNALQIRLSNEKKHLDSLNTRLQEREAKVNELEKALNQKDAAVDSLKKHITNALLGFANKGISVYEKNGKVYVSMEEALLFPSGSTKVQPEGIEALTKIAQALEANPDINVMVEGHTDDVPMHGSGDIKDNWDLSVMRATSIVKIILQDANVNPKNIMASGVSEYDPVDPSKSAEARQKNRRTDIILTPQMSELFKILNAQ